MGYIVNICVYCSASRNLSDQYYNTAQELGHLMALRGHTLVYGGGNLGMMGALASSMKKHGGGVVGVIPRDLQERELGFHQGDELIITARMQERKHLMDKRSQGFICLPGGFGTLDELFETITLKQLGFMKKPIALVNSSGFFDSLRPFLEQLTREGFVSDQDHSLYRIVEVPEQALDYLEQYHFSEDN